MEIGPRKLYRGMARFALVSIVLWSLGACQKSEEDDTLTNFLLLTVLSNSATVVQGTITETGSMSTGRYFTDAVLLSDGKVLVAGGTITGSTAGVTNNYNSTAEIYDPSSGTWSATTGNLDINRHSYGAVRLANGNVVLLGGQTGNNTTGNSANTTTGTVYNASAGTFAAATGNLNSSPRSSSPPVLLNTGNVLMAAGGGGSMSVHSTADLFTSATSTIGTTGSLATARSAHTATLLSDGKVLITGGRDGSNNSLSSAELYDPAGTFSTTGSMPQGRVSHSAVRLSDGSVLIFGGGTGATSILSYSGGTFSTLSATIPSTLAGSIGNAHHAILLNDGRVFLGCGFSSFGVIYNPTTGTVFSDPAFSSTTGLISCQSAVLMSDGRVLLIAPQRAFLYTPPST